VVFLALVSAGKHSPTHDPLSYGSLFVCWWAIALGFNLASTVTVSLLSKQLPPEWNKWTSLAIQYSNYTGRVTGAVWGGFYNTSCWIELILRRWFRCQSGYAELRRPRAGCGSSGCALLHWFMEGLKGKERLRDTLQYVLRCMSWPELHYS
jgi:hypothetical protein